MKKIHIWCKNANYETEIIIVNDGSNDSTLLLINEYIAENNFKINLINNSKNIGKGHAVKAGMQNATGDYYVFTDADLPFGLDIINKIIYYLDFKEFDLCIGNRKSIRSDYYQRMSSIRKIASSIFTFIISRYVVTGMSDTQCGIKGFRASAAKKLFSQSKIVGFAFDVEILYLAFKYELDVKRLPVNFQGINESTINLPLSSVKMLIDIFYIPFRYHLKK